MTKKKKKSPPSLKLTPGTKPKIYRSVERKQVLNHGSAVASFKLQDFLQRRNSPQTYNVSGENLCWPGVFALHRQDTANTKDLSLPSRAQTTQLCLTVQKSREEHSPKAYTTNI